MEKRRTQVKQNRTVNGKAGIVSAFWGIVCTAALSVQVVVADAGQAGLDLKYGMNYDSTPISLEGASKILVVLTKLQQNFPLDSWAWSVGAVALAFLLYHLRQYNTQKPGVPMGILSLCFGVIQVLGLSICKLDSWAFVSDNFYQLLLALFCMLGYAGLFYHAVWGLYVWLQRAGNGRLRQPRSKLAMAFDRYPGRVAAALILLGWTPWVLACLPGSVDWDSHTQICQVLGSMEMTDHHTVLSTWLHGGCLWLGRMLGSDNLGVFFYIFLQCLVCAWAYGQVVAFCAKLRCPRGVQYDVTAFFALVPAWGAFAQSMVKDTLFAAVFTLFFVYTADLLLFPKAFRETKVLWLRYGIVALLSCLLRKNGSYAVVPTLVLVAVLVGKSGLRKICAGIAVGTVAVYLGFGLFTGQILGIPSAGGDLLLSIPLQQTGRYVCVYPDEVTEEERQAIDAVVDYEQIRDSYEPQISDGMMALYKDPSRQELQTYFATWFSMFLKHPTCYLQATQANSFGYYTIAESRSPYEYYMYINQPSMDWKELNIAYLDTGGTARYLLYQWGLLFKRIPVLGLLTNRGFVVWGLVAMLCWLFRRRRVESVPLAVCLGIYWLTLLASPVNDLLRYFLPILACSPVVLAISLLAGKKSGQNTR